MLIVLVMCQCCVVCDTTKPFTCVPVHISGIGRWDDLLITNLSDTSECVCMDSNAMLQRQITIFQLPLNRPCACIKIANTIGVFPV